MKKINQDQENKNLCENCDDCCRYIATEINKPRSKQDYQNIIWYLLHENVGVYIDWDNDWYLEFLTPCRALHNKLCAVYNDRPQMCREYKQTDCTHYNKTKPEKIYFHNDAEFKKYLKKKKINFELKK